MLTKISMLRNSSLSKVYTVGFTAYQIVKTRKSRCKQMVPGQAAPSMCCCCFCRRFVFVFVCFFSDYQEVVTAVVVPSGARRTSSHISI